MKEDAAMLEIDGESIEETGEGMDPSLQTELLLFGFFLGRIWYSHTRLQWIGKSHGLERAQASPAHGTSLSVRRL